MSTNPPLPHAAATASDVRAVDPRQLPIRLVEGEFFRQTSPKRDPLSLPHTAAASGRYHRKGQQPRLYASSTRDTAWGELFRHTEPEVSPFEVRRRMSTLRVTELPVLDLTDPHVQRTLGINKRNLIRNRPAVCRRIADLVRQAPDRFGGLLAPSAANPNERTLVVFREWIPDHVVVTHSRVGAPPMRLIGLLQRVLETLPLTVQDRARWLLAELRRRS